jgi:hypothetical protein
LEFSLVYSKGVVVNENKEPDNEKGAENEKGADNEETAFCPTASTSILGL